MVLRIRLQSITTLVHNKFDLKQCSLTWRGSSKSTVLVQCYSLLIKVCTYTNSQIRCINRVVFPIRGSTKVATFLDENSNSPRFVFHMTTYWRVIKNI